MNKIRIVYKRVDELIPYENNPRINDKAVNYVVSSIKEFGFKNPIIIDNDNVIVAGHTRLKACKVLGIKEVPCIYADDLTKEQIKAFRLADNKTAEMSSWDLRLVDLELKDLNIDMLQFGFTDMDTIDFDNLENRTGEADENYQSFEDKFKPKKTTDDCFTPKEVYEAVKDWVMEEYSISKEREIIRPFYPGGDYENYSYPKDCVVIDNPPFSILSKIIDFYENNKIDYFLFAPSLTLFSSNRECQYIVNSVGIVYENGANVNTSFITNMDKYKIRTAPALRERIINVQKKDTKPLPKYDYPLNLVTAARLNKIANAGVDFKIKESQCFFVRFLDSQKEYGSEIYGGGFLISDKAAKEKEEAEIKSKEIIEKRRNNNKAIPEKWELSKREKEIIKKLNKND